MARSVNLPDGRTLRASQDTPTSDWVVSLTESTPSRWEGRWLLMLIYQALDLERGVKQPQAIALVDRLSGFDTPIGRRFRCPCCDYLTFAEAPPGTHQTCPVCKWEDDAPQYEDLDQLLGANGVSLRQARENFQRHGYSGHSHAKSVRPPESYEIPAA
jgi:hypothetical protein